ncbi:putative uncharacterized protein DDB_G0282133 [Cydia splendana]|uniref:putative uncharacterized protein DDB_G0282133 n=1 Tax=Cydia splendana TaxID=1100963 RepID=UPI00300C6F4D
MEEDDSDSDRTVLLTDFVDKPQKVDAKRRRLSQLQDRSKHADQHDKNTARNDVSQNIQPDLPKNIGNNWLINKYLSSINKTNIRNNTPGIRGNEYLNENAPKYALHCQTHAGNTENTAKFNDSVICLDSDDKTISNEQSQNQDTNKGETGTSSVNDLLHETKLIGLKPAAINARRATIDIIESNQMFSNDNVSQKLKGNEPARVELFKPSTINARRATTHFEENNLECNSSNGKDYMSKNDKMESGNNKRIYKDSYRFISPKLSPLESNIRNTTSSTSSNTNAGISVTTGAENSLTSILTVSNNKLNTDISDSNIRDNKDFQKDTENKTVSNVKAIKRSGNNETQIEPKRTKMNLKPKCKQYEDTEQMPNEKCKPNEMYEEISNETNEEHVSHDKAINDTIRPAKCDGHNENKSSLKNNVCEAEKELEENILPGKQEISKVQYEHVINEAPTKPQITRKPLNQDANAKKYPEISQVPRVQETCDRDNQDGSKMQENRDANKKSDKLETSECVLDKTIANKISIILKTRQVVDETAPTEANTEPKTFEDQDSANEVLNTVGAIKILDKTPLSTTNEAQESTQVQNELETTKVQNRQIKSKVSDKKETNKLYEEQRTIETLNREDNEEETRKVSGEQSTTESHSEHETDQLNKTPKEVSPNVGAEDNKRMLAFQIFFFSKILKNFIKDEYPEFAITLGNIIETLLDNARHGSFQTHVQFACPKCGCLSNYSSNLMNRTKSGVDKFNSNSSQNCRLCRGVRELHTSYLENASIKKDHIGNKKEDVKSSPAKKSHAKQLVEQSDKSVTQKSSSNSKGVLEENDNNGSVSRYVVEDRCDSLAVDKEKQADNISSTQNAMETQTGNHNDSKEHKINSETPFIETSETETQGKIKITSNNKNEIVSNKDKFTISNTRINEIDEQSAIHTRMKTATESNKTQNEENLKTKDNSSYLTTDFQSDNTDNSAIENNKKMDQAKQINSNSAVELPKKISSGIQNVTPSLGSSHENNKASCSKRDNSSNLVNPAVVVGSAEAIAACNSDAEINLGLRTEQNDYTTAEKASSSPTETHMHTTNLNMQEMSLKPKSHSNNIITAETDLVKTKSNKNSNEIVNGTPIDPTSLNISSVGVEENDKHFEKEAQMRNANEVHRPNENITISLKENLQLNNNANEEEGSHEEKQNDDSKDTVPDNVDNSNTICRRVDGASENITTTALTNQTTTNSGNRKSSTNSDMSCNEDEERCESDESSSYGDHSYKPSESSNEEDDNKRDENKTKTLIISGEGTSTDDNAHSTSKNQTYTFICELCNQMLYSDYARRKHRIRQHPNMQGRPIFKKIKNDEPKDNTSKSKNERERLVKDNNSSSSTDRDTNVAKINNTKGGKVRKRKANNSANASDSDWSTVSNSDYFDESSTRERKAHKNKGCTENTETVSKDEIIKTSDHLVRKRKKRTTKLFGAERQGSRAATIKENAESEENDSNSNYSITTSSSTDEYTSSSLNTSFIVNSSDGTDDEMEEDYDSQKTDVGESNDDSYLTTDEEDRPVSNNKTLNTSMRTSKKRKQRFLKNDLTDTDETDGDQQVASEVSDNELLTDHDSQYDNNEIASTNFGEEKLSDDEIIKVSENTRKKRKERMSTLFDDDIEMSAQNNDGIEQELNNETNNLTNPVVDKSGSEEVKINKNYEEIPDLRKCENDYENFINVRDDQVQSKKVYTKTNDRDCDMDPAIESTDTTVVSKQKNTSGLSNVILRDDDRHEIDLIDCLLKEYNTPNVQRNDSCAEKEKNGEDNAEPDIHNDQTGANIDNQPLLPPEINNCLEKIQIINEGSEILSSLENAVQQMSIDTDSNINREVTKDELLSQNTNDNIDIIEDNFNIKSIADSSAQIMSTADDVNLKRDLLKEDNSQKTLDISEENLVNKSTVVNATRIGSNVEDLNIKQEMLKNEVYSQNTIEEDIQECTKAFEEHLETVGSEQLMVIDEDLIKKKEMLKDESFSQNTYEENSQDIIDENLVNKTATDSAQMNLNDADLITKRDMLKDETLSENTIEEEKTDISEKPLQNRGSALILVVGRVHNIEGDMLKNESTAQNTNKDNQNNLHIEEIVNNIEIQTQTMSSIRSEDSNVPSHSLRSQVNNEEENLESENAGKDNLAIEGVKSKVVETEDAIVIEDSDDDDVELVGEIVTDQRFVRRRPDNGNNLELYLW